MNEKILAKGKVFLGKIRRNPENPRSPKACKCFFEYELKQDERGPAFSMSGEAWQSNGNDCFLAGQCCDEIANLVGGLSQRARRMLEIWRLYHLNDMHAGTQQQEAEIDRRAALEKVEHPECCYPNGELNFYALGHKLLGNGDHYDLALKWLKEAGLYEVLATEDLKASALGGWNEDTYTYGARWLYWEIPQSVVDEILAWTPKPEAVAS